jgi:hypothetical protein
MEANVGYQAKAAIPHVAWEQAAVLLAQHASSMPQTAAALLGVPWELMQTAA